MAARCFLWLIISCMRYDVVISWGTVTVPISKYKLYGYPSKEAAANDWNNLQAAHYICNAEKKDKTNYQFQQKLNPKPRPNNVPDGDW